MTALLSCAVACTGQVSRFTMGVVELGRVRVNECR